MRVLDGLNSEALPDCGLEPVVQAAASQQELTDVEWATQNWLRSVVRAWISGDWTEAPPPI